MFQLWKGTCLVWKDTHRNLIWNIGDGCHVRFWYDPWLGDLSPIVKNLVVDTYIDDGATTVADMANEFGQW
ncbi:hypothetical protein GQ457_07G008510 [Hibiscus cannabinus]